MRDIIIVFNVQFAIGNDSKEIYTGTMLYVGTLQFFCACSELKSLLQSFNAMKKSKALSRLCKLSHFKMTGISCTDTVRENGTLIA